MVEWEDEFGRTRTGTAAQRAREQRLAQLGSEAALRSRPDMPTNLIIGDTVQAAAFNPDEPVAQQMAELAAKRDRSLTPPPDTHFDASKEIRQKGVGFMQFSLDDQERKKQFENLEMERAETERVRAERLKVRYSTPTFFIKVNRSMISFKIGLAISFFCAESFMLLKNSRESLIDKAETSPIFRPSIFTAKARWFSR